MQHTSCAPFLRPGDVIGIAAPSWLITPEETAAIQASLTAMGFRARLADGIHNRCWGYAASDTARARGFNGLIRDPEVKLVFFGGGEGADDLLPLIDYEAAAKFPKLYLSYSDGTSILNALHDRTGLIMHYGQSPGMLRGMSGYDLSHFRAHLMEGAAAHAALTEWRCLTPGRAQGRLIGGYLDNFIFLMGCGWVRPRPGQNYVLFLEDNERFFGIEHESVLLTRLEQSAIMPQVSGLLFGHYSTPVNEHLMERLTRLGQRHGIPVCYCDDFGHGAHHAILPIGREAVLDSAEGTLRYL